jgi:hypothetical protein
VNDVINGGPSTAVGGHSHRTMENRAEVLTGTVGVRWHSQAVLAAISVTAIRAASECGA